MQNIMDELKQIGTSFDEDKWSRKKATALIGRLINLRQQLENDPEDNRFFIIMRIGEIDEHLKILEGIHGRDFRPIREYKSEQRRIKKRQRDAEYYARTKPVAEEATTKP